MINKEIIEPKSIAIIGGSNNIQKPGGKIVKNIIDSSFDGELYVVNPGSTIIQGVPSFPDIYRLPKCELAILAIAAKDCVTAVEQLIERGTMAFIIISAGFGEESEAGAQFEARLSQMVIDANACLIGPNCIGLINKNYHGVFTTPIPKVDSRGMDFVSSSGATAVFIMERAMLLGMQFNSVFSVGNAAHTCVEDVLEYWDTTYDPKLSSQIKLMYIESITDASKLLKHTRSLISKGCKIAAIKSGVSAAGSRAASSHTGAMASSDSAVRGLFRKAGIVYCSSREELIAVASVFSYPKLKGNNIAVITHAGGPAVMLTDVLSKGGMKVPEIKGTKADELLTKLYPGSSISNPIDFLATGTAEQLGTIIDYVNNEFDEIDGICVVFGSSGLFRVDEVYKVLNEKMKSTKKPIYPVLPSLINAEEEVNRFIENGHINFPDEVNLGEALSQVRKQLGNPIPESFEAPAIDKKQIDAILGQAQDGYLSPDQVKGILDASGIPRVKEKVVYSSEEALTTAQSFGFPMVMKVVGPIHKSDVGGVVLNIREEITVQNEFKRMMQIPETTGILMQQMLSGTELFAGAIAEPQFGHQVMAGLGGIFIEILHDIQSGLAPLSKPEIDLMLKRLKGYQLLEGVRGQEGINIPIFKDIIARLSALVHHAPEIKEMDLNPLLGKPDEVVAVDARIRIEK